MTTMKIVNEMVDDALATAKAQMGGMTQPSCFTAGGLRSHAFIVFRSAFMRERYATFKAYIESYSDSWSSNWNEESVFARMDPIATFQNTVRKINLTFKVVSEGGSDAQCNISQVEKLISFMYPVWDSLSHHLRPTPQAPPLIEMRFSNLISASGLHASKRGIMGYIGNLNVNHEVDAGWLFVGGKMFPKEITIGFDFTVLHEFTPGSSYGFEDKHSYPYGQPTRDNCVGASEKLKRKKRRNADGTPAAAADPTPAPTLDADKLINGDGSFEGWEDPGVSDDIVVDKDGAFPGTAYDHNQSSGPVTVDGAFVEKGMSYRQARDAKNARAMALSGQQILLPYEDARYGRDVTPDTAAARDLAARRLAGEKPKRVKKPKKRKISARGKRIRKAVDFFGQSDGTDLGGTSY